ncbi:MAG: hypothetical protein N4A76_04185 [Firmicutes bacterium]|jgi:nucleoside-triphosphatase THEP1|nr:hypothetical protein [Bacillota bacterium]
MKIVFEGIDNTKKNYIINELLNDDKIGVSGFHLDKIQKSQSYNSYYIKGLGDEFYDISKEDDLMVGRIDFKGNIVANPEAFDLFGVNSLLHNIHKKNLLIMECVNNLGKEANIFKEVANDILNSNKSVIFLTDKIDESIVKTMSLRSDIHYLNFDCEDYSIIKTYIEKTKDDIRKQ